MKINSSLLMDDVWDRIEEEIRKQNRTKLSVAEQCGFNKQVLFKNPHKHRGILLVYFARLCTALNVSADYLLFGEKKEG